MRRSVTHDATRAPTRAGGLAAGLLAFLAVLAPGAPADAQQSASAAGGARWFPDTTVFAPLLADPRDTGLRGGFILADRPDLEEVNRGFPDPPPPGTFTGSDFEGRNIEAEVALGLRLPIVLLRDESGGGPSVAIEFESGVFSRFFMEEPEKDLIHADFRVGAPVAFGYRGWQARVELRHMSSHFGDDFVRRFDPPFAQISQEGFELLLARRWARGVRIYGGGEWNFGISDPELIERALVHWGLEYDPGAVDGRRRIWPFAAADFRITDLTDRVAASGVAGVAFRVRTVLLRLETRGHFGPTPMGQLRSHDENFWGVGLRIEPTGAY